MIKDLSSCKEKALSIVKSENPPWKPNGHKFGYMEVKKQTQVLHLNLSPQNLVDILNQNKPRLMLETIVVDMLLYPEQQILSVSSNNDNQQEINYSLDHNLL